MPTKHIVKSFDAPAYYHVYNRASGERKLFRDNQDRQYFLDLLRTHLLEVPSEQSELERADIRKYDLNIVAFCLMGSHFHLLLFQHQDPDAMTGYMRSVSTKYSMYYNKKYKSKGHVFQSSYRASLINNEAYLAHITRYIHLNPRLWESWQWSSYQAYINKLKLDWVHPELVLSHGPRQYESFVKEYDNIDLRTMRKELHEMIAT